MNVLPMYRDGLKKRKILIKEGNNATGSSIRIFRNVTRPNVLQF